MGEVARGAFTVQLKPQGGPDKADGTTLGRMSINKRFEGDIEGVSVGEMLSALTTVEGSAGYVAIERVTARVHGRSGSFILQHSGKMARGVQSLSIQVVADSGTGQLAGLTGDFRLTIIEGRHQYEFEYQLPQ